MTNNNELALYRRPITPTVWSMINSFAIAAQQSGQIGVTKPQIAVVKMVAAYEMNLPLITALRDIYIIDQKPVIAPRIIWGMVLRHPDFYGSRETMLVDDDGKFHGWEITLQRQSPSGVIEATRRWTMDDAENAGLTGKNNWVKYPRNMCFWRAMAHAQDALFADATLGRGRAEYTDLAISEQGDIIDGEVEFQTMFDPQTEMQSLIDYHGAKKVSVALADLGITNPTTEDDFKKIKWFFEEEAIEMERNK